MIDFKITKRQKLLEVNNDMVHNYYYLIYGKLYNESKTKYRKFKFVVLFDIFDVQEYFDKYFITNEDISEYLNETSCCCIENIKSYDDEKSLKEFYQYCNNTINDYNKIICRG